MTNDLFKNLAGMKQEDDNYVLEVNCPNCQKKAKFEVPKGTKKEKVLKDEVCLNCGCKLQ